MEGFYRSKIVTVMWQVVFEESVCMRVLQVLGRTQENIRSPEAGGQACVNQLMWVLGS